MAAPRLLQQTNRTQHTTNSGIEIIRTFNCEPYEAHVDVIKALQGSVAKDDNERWIRTPPSHDTYIRNCYCMETRVDFWDGDAMASSPDIEDGAGSILKKLEDTPEKPTVGAAGAKITAIYRPLITAWESSSQRDPDPEAFDWIDPTFVPGTRQLPWPGGLFIRTQLALTKDVPPEVSSPIEISVTTVTIRRILVGEPPWDLISAMAGSVNAKEFPGPDSRAISGLPKFHPQTLKFKNAAILNMMDASGARWYEITYTFEWIQHATEELIDFGGTKESGLVTWNHVFMSPAYWLGLKGPAGWYLVWRNIGDDRLFGGKIQFNVFGAAISAGLLHNEADFTKLFELNP